MEKENLMGALVQLKRMGKLCDEVSDITRQLADAVDRDDRVSIELVMGMRQEPIDKMSQVEDALHLQVESLPEQDAMRLSALLNGGEAKNEDERLIEAQVASNSRALKRVVEMDQAVNQKLAREKSIFNTPKV